MSFLRSTLIAVVVSVMALAVADALQAQSPRGFQSNAFRNNVIASRYYNNYRYRNYRPRVIVYPPVYRSPQSLGYNVPGYVSEIGRRSLNRYGYGGINAGFGQGFSSGFSSGLNFSVGRFGR